MPERVKTRGCRYRSCEDSLFRTMNADHQGRRVSLRSPLLVGEVFAEMLRDPAAPETELDSQPGAASSGDEPADPALMRVSAGHLRKGDVIPGWPDGTVTRAPSRRAEGRVDVEISGTDVDIEASEQIEILRHYEAFVPGAFVAAAAQCYPAGVPGVLGERQASRFGPVDLTLRVTYAEMIDLMDLAASVLWECLQDPDVAQGAADSAYVTASRLVSEGTRMRG